MAGTDPGRSRGSPKQLLSSAVLLCLVCVSALAEEAAGGAVDEAARVAEKAVRWTLSLDPFTLAVIFLFLATIVGVIVKGRLRDRCLRSYHKYPVKVVLDNVSKGGRFALGNAGFEILPEEPENTAFGNRLGFILYQNEYGRLRYIVRDPAALGKREARRRRRRLKRIRKPGMVRRFGRWLSNLAGSFKDAFNDLLSLMMGRFRPQAVADLSRGREKYAGRMESEVLSLLPNTSYDAILERLRGRIVEVEAKVENFPPALSGVLEEYTATYVAVMNALVPAGPAEKIDTAQEEGGGKRSLENKSDGACFVPEANWRLLKPGEKMTLPGDSAPKPLKAAPMDILLPRSLAVVRFRLEDEAA